MIYFVWFVLVLLISWNFANHESWFLAIVFFLGSSFCFLGGCGMKGSLLTGNKWQKFAGTFLGILFLVLGSALIYYSNARPSFMGLVFEKEYWGLVNFLIGLIFTSKKYASS